MGFNFHRAAPPAPRGRQQGLDHSDALNNSATVAQRIQDLNFVGFFITKKDGT
jgi:hypothetical protein